jgi:hypothetical protein
MGISRHLPWITLTAAAVTYCYFLLQVQQYLTTKVTADQRKSASAVPTAVLFEVSGDVRTKSANALNWQSAHFRQALFPGDQVFTGTTGTARIEYMGIGATLMLQAQSLVTIRHMPPSFTRFRRTFGMDTAGLARLPKSQSQSDARSIGAATSSTNDVDFGQGPTFNSGLSLIRDVDKIPVISPIGLVILAARSFPADLPIRFEETWNQVGLWGFLWQTDATLTPIWSGFSRGSFPAIPIPGPGEYTLQIITEDESRTTEPIQITASRRTELTLPQWPHATADSPVSVVLK